MIRRRRGRRSGRGLEVGLGDGCRQCCSCGRRVSDARDATPLRGAAAWPREGARWELSGEGRRRNGRGGFDPEPTAKPASRHRRRGRTYRSGRPLHAGRPGPAPARRRGPAACRSAPAGRRKRAGRTRAGDSSTGTRRERLSRRRGPGRRRPRRATTTHPSNSPPHATRRLRASRRPRRGPVGRSRGARRAARGTQPPSLHALSLGGCLDAVKLCVPAAPGRASSLAPAPDRTDHLAKPSGHFTCQQQRCVPMGWRGRGRSRRPSCS